MTTESFTSLWAQVGLLSLCFPGPARLQVPEREGRLARPPKEALTCYRRLPRATLKSP